MLSTQRLIVLVTPALLSTAQHCSALLSTAAAAYLETDELYGGLAQDDDGDEEDDGDRVDRRHRNLRKKVVILINEVRLE